MRKELVSELKHIAHKILNEHGQEDITALKNEVRLLYEKLTALEFIATHFREIQPSAGKGEAMRKFEELAHRIIAENTQVPESNPHEEDLIVPVMHKIKDLVAEMPKEETLEDILSGVYPNPTFVRKEKTGVASSTLTGEKISEPGRRSLNDTLKKQFHIGLNDRIGFVKHLFNGNEAAFHQALSRLQIMETHTEAMNFIEHTVKPEYNGWKGKEAYEIRFSELIEARFNP